jgi:hypothetical protein
MFSPRGWSALTLKQRLISYTSPRNQSQQKGQKHASFLILGLVRVLIGVVLEDANSMDYSRCW